MPNSRPSWNVEAAPLPWIPVRVWVCVGARRGPAGAATRTNCNKWRAWVLGVCLFVQTYKFGAPALTMGLGVALVCMSGCGCDIRNCSQVPGLKRWIPIPVAQEHRKTPRLNL